MANNILTAIKNIVSYKNYNLNSYSTKSLIRINAVGDQLEYYIKDAISNSLDLPQKEKINSYENVFSYLGNQNNPPDMIIGKGDAFEIKKIESGGASLALNSSPPKNKLLSTDSRLTASCKNCEKWEEKDIFYVVGHILNGEIKYLFFLQGICYAADNETYSKVHVPIKNEIDSILNSLNLDHSDTRELGKVKKVDPLGITELRIRGMWHIKNPLKVYNEICEIKDRSKFHLFALIEKNKYDSFPNADIKLLKSCKGIFISDVKIKDPNNPAKLMGVKLISYMGD